MAHRSQLAAVVSETKMTGHHGGLAVHRAEHGALGGRLQALVWSGAADHGVRTRHGYPVHSSRAGHISSRARTSGGAGEVGAQGQSNSRIRSLVPRHWRLVCRTGARLARSSRALSGGQEVRGALIEVLHIRARWASCKSFRDTNITQRTAVRVLSQGLENFSTVAHWWTMCWTSGASGAGWMGNCGRRAVLGRGGTSSLVGGDCAEDLLLRADRWTGGDVGAVWGAVEAVVAQVAAILVEAEMAGSCVLTRWDRADSGASRC